MCKVVKVVNWKVQKKIFLMFSVCFSVCIKSYRFYCIGVYCIVEESSKIPFTTLSFVSSIMRFVQLIDYQFSVASSGSEWFSVKLLYVVNERQWVYKWCPFNGLFNQDFYFGCLECETCFSNRFCYLWYVAHEQCIQYVQMYNVKQLYISLCIWIVHKTDWSGVLN